MLDFSADRIEMGLYMPGVFGIPQTLPIGEAIDELVLIAEYSLENEWRNQIRFLPLQ